MVLAKRERFILLVTLIVVGTLLVDRLVLTPLLDRRAAVAAQKAGLELELGQAQEWTARERQLAPKWKEMTRNGMKNDSGEAEKQVLHAIRDWAEEAGVSVSQSLQKSDRSAEKGRLPQLLCQVSGRGTMSALARLLWRIQTATIPVKLMEMQISAAKEGVDDLTFELRISTVYSPAGPSSPALASARPNPDGGRP